MKANDDYIIAEAASTYLLMEKVNEYLKDNYLCIGGVSYSPRGDCFVQAMVADSTYAA